jgi:7-cyano-7-deazaguanine synthase
VYLTGRNIVLLSKAAIYCAQHGLSRIALGPLAGNPFPDATPEFFGAMAHALSLGLAHRVAIETPFATMDKGDVIRLGIELGVPLALTLSCMNPQNGLHCGQCSKCRERRDGFADAGVPDPTAYATVPLR